MVLVSFGGQLAFEVGLGKEADSQWLKHPLIVSKSAVTPRSFEEDLTVVR